MFVIRGGDYSGPGAVVGALGEVENINAGRSVFFDRRVFGYFQRHVLDTTLLAFFVLVTALETAGVSEACRRGITHSSSNHSISRCVSSATVAPVFIVPPS